MIMHRIALAGAVCVIGAAAQAATMPVASAFLEGSYEAVVDGSDEGGSSVTASGSFGLDFAGYLGLENPSMPMDYTLSGRILVDGQVIDGGSLSLQDVNLQAGAANLISAVGPIVGLLAANACAPQNIGSVQVEYCGTVDTTGLAAGQVSGTYEFSAFSRVALVGDALTSFLISSDPTGLIPEEGFAIPNEGSGSFRIELALVKDMAAVPLPAGAPLLLMGLAGLGAAARRRSRRHA